MTEKEKPNSSNDSNQGSKEPIEKVNKTDELEKKVGSLIEKGHLKNSWEKPIPSIDPKAILKPPAATATAKPAEGDKTDKK